MGVFLVTLLTFISLAKRWGATFFCLGRERFLKNTKNHKDICFLFFFEKKQEKYEKTF